MFFVPVVPKSGEGRQPFCPGGRRVVGLKIHKNHAFIRARAH